MSRMVIKPKALQKLGIVSTDAPENDCNDKSMQSDAQERPLTLAMQQKKMPKMGRMGSTKLP